MARYIMAKYVQLSDLIYFDQKATDWNKEHFVFKQDGMSLISDTTVTAIVNHLMIILQIRLRHSVPVQQLRPHISGGCKAL